MPHASPLLLYEVDTKQSKDEAEEQHTGQLQLPYGLSSVGEEYLIDIMMLAPYVFVFRWLVFFWLTSILLICQAC